jgi:hypothetical protein
MDVCFEIGHENLSWNGQCLVDTRIHYLQNMEGVTAKAKLMFVTCNFVVTTLHKTKPNM